MSNMREQGIFIASLLVALAWGAEAAESSRKYAPQRRVDILHIKIDVTPDFSARRVTGVTDITFTPLLKPLRELILDACDLEVEAIWSQRDISAWHAEDHQIAVLFSEAIDVQDQVTIHIRYQAQPKQGLYFRTPERGYRPENMHLFTQGESHEARHWFPCYDYPNERFTSEVICRVPADMTVVSNGRLVSEEISDGIKVSHWHQEKPHVCYLIALTAGYFEKISLQHGDIPMGFYVPTTYVDVAANSFAGTADMMDYFEQEIGVPYPWLKYDQIVVEDFVAGGMENTSATILTHRTLFTADSGRLRSSLSLVAHELAHQWFGDYVTCKDWTNLWLNEGFATFYENLYLGHRFGRNRFLYDLYRDARSILRRKTDQLAIYHRTYNSENQQFDYRAYAKGGWVLHMLRSRLGEDLYRRCIRTYLERHALGTVETADLRSVIEELSGQPYDQFFDQWVYYAGFPKLRLRYSWSQTDGLAKVSIKQTPSQDKGAVTFHLPATLRFIVDGVAVDREVVIGESPQDVYVALDAKPEIVRFDPDFTLLAEIDFKKSKPMLYAQLANEQDVIGQFLALQALESHDDQTTIDRIKTQLNQAAFYGTRLAAANALEEVHNDRAYEALVASLEQPDERVRERVLVNLGEFYRDQSRRILLEQVDGESNPVVVTSCIRSLGRYHHPDVDRLLIGSLDRSSFQNRIAEAAVAAMGKRADPSFVAPLQQALTERHAEFTASGLGSALRTLGRLAGQLDEKDAIRDFLVGFVNDPRGRVQAGAIGGLGGLADPQAIAIVETFESTGRRQVDRAARNALEALRKETPIVAQEVIDMRKRVTDLAEANKKLAERLDDLEQRLGAKEEAKEQEEDETVDQD